YPAKARHDIEARVIPRQGLHVTKSDVAVGIAVASNSEQPRRRIDPRTGCAAKPRQLDGQARAARDVENAVAVTDVEPLVHSRVLTPQRLFTEGRPVDRPPSPTLVDHLPRHWCALSSGRITIERRPCGSSTPPSRTDRHELSCWRARVAACRSTTRA